MSVSIPQQLIEKLRFSECVAFIGAGFSVRAGFPTWYQLIGSMILWCEKNKITLDRSIAEAMDTGRLIEASNEIFHKVTEKCGTEEIQKLLNSILADSEKQPQTVHRLLSKIPFTAVFTTNFDTLLERQYPTARVFTYQSNSEYVEYYREKHFHIFKLHGTVSNVPCIWTERHFAELKYASHYRELQEHLKVVLSSRTILFMGYSFRDPDMEMVLAYLKTNHGAYAGKHYALLPSSELTTSRERDLRENYSIEAIHYNHDFAHTNVEVFLRKLAFLAHQ